jgi:hypothetical protein
MLAAMRQPPESPTVGRLPCRNPRAWRVALGLALSLAGAGCVPDPLRYAAPRAATAPTLDGRLDEPAWARATWTAEFVDIEGDARPRPAHRTRVKMLWDDEFLYVGAWLDEPHLLGSFTQHDSIIYRENDFEVFIDPEGDALWYGEVELNALGTLFDLMLDKPYNRGGRPIIEGWTPPRLAAAVSIDGTLNDPSDVDRGWGLEIALPFESLAEHAGVPVPPRPGDVWRINFSRVQWTYDVLDGRYLRRPNTPEDNWVWSPQGVINMHVPGRWGFLEFRAESDA